ncbi:ABC transporter substrate-binding protein [Rhodococcus sp. ABRD24]|nr:ABC transporter substrate-binding protein [Rhodococcus sp. ABRD24]
MRRLDPDRQWAELTAALTRRGFLGALGVGAALLAAGCGSGSAADSSEAETRTVTTPLGTYEDPVSPKRVIAVDSRLDLEPAVALGLPLIGYNHSRARAWVPVDPTVPYLGEKPNLEQILGLAPDLIICCNAGGDWWPTDRLQEIAPVLTTDFGVDWRENFAGLANWLGATDQLARIDAEYEALIAEIAARHRALKSSTTVASISYLPSDRMVYVTSTKNQGKGLLPTEATLTEIGGRSPSRSMFSDAENGLSLEHLDLIAECDGFMFTGSREEYDALMSETLWSRLPAVQAGHVTLLEGETYYGSVYTVPIVARGWDALYTRMAAA